MHVPHQFVEANAFERIRAASQIVVPTRMLLPSESCLHPSADSLRSPCAAMAWCFGLVCRPAASTIGLEACVGFALAGCLFCCGAEAVKVRSCFLSVLRPPPCDARSLFFAPPSHASIGKGVNAHFVGLTSLSQCHCARSCEYVAQHAQHVDPPEHAQYDSHMTDLQGGACADALQMDCDRDRPRRVAAM